MTAIGMRIELRVAKWPENLKAARAGKLQMWSLGSLGRRRPTSQGALRALTTAGRSAARTWRASSMPAFDAIYEQHAGDARRARAAARCSARPSSIAVAYMPYKYTSTASSPT